MSLIWPDYLVEADGERRFKGSRATPWVVLHFYNALGYSAEMLAMEFPSVSLPAIHRFLAFYIENAGEMDALATEEEAEIDRLRAASPNHVTLAELRKRCAADDSEGMTRRGRALGMFTGAPTRESNGTRTGYAARLKPAED